MDTAGRHLPDLLHPLELVETLLQPLCAHDNELGRRHRLRPHPGLFHLRLHRAELHHPLLLAREVAACGRLPVGEQSHLRTARAPDARTLPPHAAHPAGGQHTELPGEAAAQLPPSPRPAQRGTRRHRGVQLPPGRHRAHSHRPGQRRLLRHHRAPARPGHSRPQSLHSRQPAALRRGEMASRRPPRELCETCHRPPRRAPDDC